jgi:hypothetical protein
MKTKNTRVLKRRPPHIGLKFRLPRLGRWELESGFRFVMAFTVEHNAQRFVKHVEHMQRAMRQEPGALRFALKVRRLHGRRPQP